MPKMNGAQMVRILERINPGVRVISASGLIEDDAYGEEMTGSVRAVLQKPFSPAQLLKTLRNVLHAS